MRESRSRFPVPQVAVVQAAVTVLALTCMHGRSLAQSAEDPAVFRTGEPDVRSVEGREAEALRGLLKWTKEDTEGQGEDDKLEALAQLLGGGDDLGLGWRNRARFLTLHLGSGRTAQLLEVWTGGSAEAALVFAIHEVDTGFRVFRFWESEKTIEVPVNPARDLDGDGVSELLLIYFVGEYLGGDTSVDWTYIFRWNGSAWVRADADFPRYYLNDVLPRYDEMLKVCPESLKSETYGQQENCRLLRIVRQKALDIINGSSASSADRVLLSYINSAGGRVIVYPGRTRFISAGGPVSFDLSQGSPANSPVFWATPVGDGERVLLLRKSGEVSLFRFPEGTDTYELSEAVSKALASAAAAPVGLRFFVLGAWMAVVHTAGSAPFVLWLRSTTTGLESALERLPSSIFEAAFSIDVPGDCLRIHSGGEKIRDVIPPKRNTEATCDEPGGAPGEPDGKNPVSDVRKEEIRDEKVR